MFRHVYFQLQPMLGINIDDICRTTQQTTLQQSQYLDSADDHHHASYFFDFRAFMPAVQLTYGTFTQSINRLARRDRCGSTRFGVEGCSKPAQIG